MLAIMITMGALYAWNLKSESDLFSFEIGESTQILKLLPWYMSTIFGNEETFMVPETPEIELWSLKRYRKQVVYTDK